MKKVNIKLFVASYLNTAAWTVNDSLNWNKEFTKEAMERAKQECETFIGLVEIRLGEVEANRLLSIEGDDLTYRAAHDFWLTRNGHGAGFWDSPHIYGAVECNVLTILAEHMGTVDCSHVKGPRSKLTFD